MKLFTLLLIFFSITIMSRESYHQKDRINQESLKQGFEGLKKIILENTQQSISGDQTTKIQYNFNNINLIYSSKYIEEIYIQYGYYLWKEGGDYSIKPMDFISSIVATIEVNRNWYQEVKIHFCSTLLPKIHEYQINQQSKFNKRIGKIDIGNGYFKDQKHIYIKSEYGTFWKVEQADVKSFRTIAQGIGKDNRHMFSGRHIVKNAEYDTFKHLSNSGFSKDKNHVYNWDRKIISDADPTTFIAIGEHYGKDKNHIYYIFDRYKTNHIVKGADVSSFRVLANQMDYGKDKTNVFMGCRVIEKADPKSFIVFEKEDNYARDKNYIFNDGSIIKGADKESFEILSYNLSRDKNSVFSYHKKIDFDRDSFEIIGRGIYGKDKNGVYDLNPIVDYKKIPFADPKSFEEILINLGVMGRLFIQKMQIMCF